MRVRLFSGLANETRKITSQSALDFDLELSLLASGGY